MQSFDTSSVIDKDMPAAPTKRHEPEAQNEALSAAALQELSEEHARVWLDERAQLLKAWTAERQGFDCQLRVAADKVVSLEAQVLMEHNRAVRAEDTAGTKPITLALTTPNAWRLM
jgi:hypothetical protein